jgi:hypothetical protein
MTETFDKVVFQLSHDLLYAIFQREVTAFRTNELSTLLNGIGATSLTEISLVLFDLIRKDLSTCPKKAFKTWRHDLMIVGETILERTATTTSCKSLEQLGRLLDLTKIISERVCRSPSTKSHASDRHKTDFEFVSDDERT